MDAWEMTTLVPGSPEARQQGCICDPQEGVDHQLGLVYRVEPLCPAHGLGATVAAAEQLEAAARERLAAMFVPVPRDFVIGTSWLLLAFALCACLTAVLAVRAGNYVAAVGSVVLGLMMGVWGLALRALVTCQLTPRRPGNSL